MKITLEQKNTELHFRVDFAQRDIPDEFGASQMIPLVNCIVREEATRNVRGAASHMVDNALRTFRMRLVEALAEGMMTLLERDVYGPVREAARTPDSALGAGVVANVISPGYSGPLTAPTLRGDGDDVKPVGK